MSGLTVTVVYVVDFPPVLQTEIRENGGELDNRRSGRLKDYFIPGKEGALSPVRTGSDGRFRLSGVGRDRMPLLSIEGGSAERTRVTVLTTTDPAYKPILMPAVSTGQSKIEGPRFELAVAPGRVIEGIVRDRDTGQPIAGAKVRSWFGETLTTDARGHFRFAGQPNAGDNMVQVTVERQPYISAAKSFNEAKDRAPVHLDIALKRGIWVEGKVTDATSGKPAGAAVVYYPFRDNPRLRECPDATVLNNNPSDEVDFPTDANGRFRAAALPGEGLLVVRASEPGYQVARPIDPELAARAYAMPGLLFYQYHAYMRIDAPAGKSLVIPDIALTPGRTQHIRVFGPDGRPLRGARVFRDCGSCCRRNACAGRRADLHPRQSRQARDDRDRARRTIAGRGGRADGRRARSDPCRAATDGDRDRPAGR